MPAGAPVRRWRVTILAMVTRQTGQIGQSDRRALEHAATFTLPA